MNALEFALFLNTHKPNKPFKVILGMKTIQKIPVPVFDGKVVKYTRGVYWVNFHLNPGQFTTSTDPEYFHPPVEKYCPVGGNINRWWGSGEYPIFSHKETGKKYLGLLEVEGEEKDKTYFVVRVNTEKGKLEEISVNTAEAEKHIPQREEPKEGEPVYFNVSLDNITFVQIIG